MTQSDSGRPARARFSPGRMIPLAVILLAAAIGVANRDAFSFQTLAENRERLLAWRDSSYLLAAGGYVLAYVLVVALSLPGALMMTLTGGFLFGLVAGSVLTVSAATLGAVAIFLAARAGLGEALQARMDASHGMMTRICEGLRENEISYLFLMRLVPAIPFFVANLAPALLGARLRNYVLTTFFGIIPGTVVYTWVGAGLGEVFARGETPDLGILFEFQILGPILALCVLSALPIARKWFRKTGEE
ncbi:TVP38/TMEM64 family protein [Rhodobacteraceae bacterium 2CG4]|uniref:TVP38/TMEM64 family membrane protein n=1 Tax=Halovulum marinum TaxID=2662447 RepID=A0A6L5Z5L5_9RHOB|nr:TVP38/TMEM64 family protein [Halovulum marinum]MSU91599.1 TVP38/TMEM64 family protein [Halovulum marinum]